MKRKICELLLIIVFYVLQCTAGRVLAIGGISPNFLIIIPVLLMVRQKEYIRDLCAE